MAFSTNARLPGVMETVLDRVRKEARLELARSCAAQLAAFGMTLQEAAQILSEEEKL